MTLVAALFGLVAGMTLVALASAGVEIPTVAPTIGVMLGLGAGIDYALFLVARHRERLAAGDDVETAAANANGTTGVAVLTAGAIVVVAISGLLAVGIPFVGRMGLAAGVVVATTAVAAVTVVPALLGMAGRRVLRPARAAATEPLPPAGPAAPSAGRAASRAARSSRPSPARRSCSRSRRRSSACGSASRTTAPSRRPRRSASPTTASPRASARASTPRSCVAVALPQDRAAAGEALQRLEAGAKAAPGVATVTAPVVNRARDAATVTVIPRTAPQDEATSALVDHLRDEVVPPPRAAPAPRRTSAARPRRSTTWRAA